MFYLFIHLFIFGFFVIFFYSRHPVLLKQSFEIPRHMNMIRTICLINASGLILLFELFARNEHLYSLRYWTPEWIYTSQTLANEVEIKAIYHWHAITYLNLSPVRTSEFIFKNTFTYCESYVIILISVTVIGGELGFFFAIFAITLHFKWLEILVSVSKAQRLNHFAKNQASKLNLVFQFIIMIVDKIKIHLDRGFYWIKLTCTNTTIKQE